MEPEEVLTSADVLQAVTDELQAASEHAENLTAVAVDQTDQAFRNSADASASAAAAADAAADAAGFAVRLEEEARLAELARINDHAADMTAMRQDLDTWKSMTLELQSNLAALNTAISQLLPPPSTLLEEAPEDRLEAETEVEAVGPETMDPPPERSLPVLRNGRRPLRRV